MNGQEASSCGRILQLAAHLTNEVIGLFVKYHCKNNLSTDEYKISAKNLNELKKKLSKKTEMYALYSLTKDGKELKDIEVYSSKFDDKSQLVLRDMVMKDYLSQLESFEINEFYHFIRDMSFSNSLKRYYLYSISKTDDCRFGGFLSKKELAEIDYDYDEYDYRIYDTKYEKEIDKQVR